MPSSNLMSFLLLLCYHLLSAPFPISLEASTPSPLQLEADALQQSGWWSGRNISQHCQWKTSIICDASGSIIDIFVDWALPAGSTLHNLNFSSLPNLGPSPPQNSSPIQPYFSTPISQSSYRPYSFRNWEFDQFVGASFG
ncbi:hypothetical protein SDJN02_06494, partial [Cucurbita argyrosperma subsp. argyrosperma]